MPRYNIALTPTNAAISARLSEVAQQYFKNMFDEYLLGDEALPHITLGDFVADNDEAAREVYKNFTNKMQMMLAVTEYQYRLSEHGNKWAEYLIEQTPDLMKMQKDVYDYLNALDFVPRQLPKTYCPQITLACVKKKPTIAPDLGDLPEPYKYKFRTALGQTTELGALTKIIG